MRPVGDHHLVVEPFLVAALAEELVVLDVGVCALALEVGVVLLAAVAGVGHEVCGQVTILSLTCSQRGMAQAVSPGRWWTVVSTMNWFSVPACTL